MSLSGLLPLLGDDARLAEALAEIAQPGAEGADLIGPAALRPFLAASLATHAGGRLVLAVTATGKEAEELAAAAGSVLPGGSEGERGVAYFPPWETLPHERLSPRPDTSGRRLAVLRRLAHPDPEDARSGPLAIVTAPVRCLLQPLVGGRGEIAGRGGILDVFPPTEEHPLRIEFWGDEVEEIRYFKVADQRSTQPAEDGLWAPACRELLLTPQVRERAAGLAE